MELLEMIKNSLEKHYGLAVEKIVKNEESTDGNVYMVYSNQDKYVIKLYRDLSHAEAMTQLHSRLISSSFNVPKIILTKDNKDYIELSDELYLVVYSFMEGEHIKINPSSKQIDSALIPPIAQFLRNLHSVVIDQGDINLPMVPFYKECNIERYSILHFDLTKNNIFKNDKNEIGFIDFDDAKYGPSVCDVAITIALLFFSKTGGINKNGVDCFIEAYYGDDFELKSMELPFIKEYALEWITYILAGNQFDTSTTESFIVKRKLIEENLFL